MDEGRRKRVIHFRDREEENNRERKRERERKRGGKQG
jgi:hypothetical protein